MNYIVNSPRFTAYLVELGIFSDAPLRLLDIGCSGGIPSRFRVYEPYLCAVGVDPVVEECDRLQLAEQNPSVRYIAAFAGLPSMHNFVKERGERNFWGADTFSFTSAMWAIDLCKKRSAICTMEDLNDWPDRRLADSSAQLGIDDLVGREAWPGVDVVKIDVDGRDFEVMLSGEATVHRSPVLGFQLEVNFFGGVHQCDHSFHNTDRLMRGWGFDLADILNIRRYSMRDLPAPFELDAVAQTTFGRPMQGDVLYLRDVVSGLSSAHASRFSPIQLLKLASLYEIYGSPDGAAQIILAFTDEIERAFPGLKIIDLLNLLVPALYGRVFSYEEYLKKFTADPRSFYSSRAPETFGVSPEPERPHGAEERRSDTGMLSRLRKFKRRFIS